MHSQHHEASCTESPDGIDDTELLHVIADFLALGHVDNIVAMFRQDPRYFHWTGPLLTDNRYAVRLGVSVLFEHLVSLCPENVSLALPSLEAQLDNPHVWMRGEALSILAIIGSEDALKLVRVHLNDPAPQVAEVAHDILDIPFNR